MKIKTAVEIALEKTKDIKISDEEIKKLKEKEARNKIEGLLNKYLEKQLELEEIIVRVEKEKESEFMKKELKKCLIHRLELNKINEMEMIYKLLTKLCSEEKIIKQIEKIFLNYTEELSKSYDEVEEVEKKRLTQYGIDGDAVVPNMALSTEFVRKRKEIFAKYTTQLNKIKNTIH